MNDVTPAVSLLASSAAWSQSPPAKGAAAAPQAAPAPAPAPAASPARTRPPCANPDALGIGRTVEIDTTSVSSGDQGRDDHFRSSDFFDVDHHPTATFRSTGVTVEGTSATLAGELTVKEITRPVTLAVEYLGHARDPWDNDRAVFTASGKINREDWGLTWNMLLEAGGLLVSKEIQLEIDVELIRQ
jgi:hypothetical protein